MVIILLSLAAYIFFYLNSKSVIRQGIIETGINSISRTAFDMDRGIYDAYRIIYNLKHDPLLSQYDTEQDVPYYDYMKMRDSLSQNVASSQMVEDIILYIASSNIVITKEGSYAMDYFFDRYMVNSSKNKYFWQKYLTTPGRFEIFPQETYGSSPYIGENNSRKLVIMAADGNTLRNIRILIVINSSRINDLYGSNLMVSDDRGIIISSNFDRKIDTGKLMEEISPQNDSGYKEITYEDGKYYTFYIKSQNYMWYYVKLIPYASVFSRLTYFNMLFVVVIIILILSSVAVSYYLSLTLYRPIKGLAGLVKGDFNEGVDARAFKNELQKIYSYVQSVNNNYAAAQKKNDMLQELYKEYFYEKLIKNSDRINYNSILGYLDISPGRFSCFSVINYSIYYKPGLEKMETEDPDYCGRINLAIRETIAVVMENMGVTHYSFETSPGKYTSIAAFDRGSFDREAFAGKVVNILKNDSEYFYIVMSFSGEYQGIEQLSRAYSEALNLMHYKTLSEETQFLFCECRKNKIEGRAPKAMMERLYTLIDLGRLDELQELLQELLDSFQSSKVPLLHIRRDFTSIFNAVIQKLSFGNTMNSERVDDIIKSIGECVTREDFSKLTESVGELKASSERKCGANHNVADSMEKYIRANYHEELSLDFFAEKYKLTSIYLSKLFKDCTGVYFSDFLQQVRMDKAKELLLDSDLMIKEIAMKVGYREANTFIKVFKKSFGVSPGEYRKLTASRE